MKVEHTERGFEIIRFEDSNGDPCSLQESSATGGFIWLGISATTVRIMARDALKLGRKDLVEGVELFGGQPTGWVDWPIPAEAEIFTRMHLSREQVKELIPHLQSWLDNDSFAVKGGAK